MFLRDQFLWEEGSRWGGWIDHRKKLNCDAGLIMPRPTLQGTFRHVVLSVAHVRVKWLGLSICALFSPWMRYSVPFPATLERVWHWVSLPLMLSLGSLTLGMPVSWCEAALQRSLLGEGLRNHVSNLGSGPSKPQPTRWNFQLRLQLQWATWLPPHKWPLSYLSHMLVRELQKLEIKYLFYIAKFDG